MASTAKFRKAENVVFAYLETSEHVCSEDIDTVLKLQGLARRITQETMRQATITDFVFLNPSRSMQTSV